MIFIGVDPGITGALAVIGEHGYVAVHDMPAMLYGKTTGRKAVNLPLLAATIRPYTALACVACVERVNAMPGQGVSSMFSMGMSFYGACGTLAGLEIPFYLVQPQAWKGYFQLNSEKERSLDLARKLYPMASLKHKKDHGRAEALLIARYAKETLH